MDTKYNQTQNLSEEKMNIQIALDLLDIDTFVSGNYENITRDFVKRKYHKMALKWHPDKNGNTIEATHKFQKINEAYSYLLTELVTELGLEDDDNEPFVSSSFFKDTNKDTNNDTNMYTSLLSVFLSSILNVDSKVMSGLLIKIIKDIVINGYKVISAKLIDDLDKEMSLELYNFLNKYKHILYVSQQTLDFVSSLIKEKYKNDSVYILNPSIDDLLDKNIYKLCVDKQLYLAPLWHNELYFEDLNKNDIIVLCIPELPENISIDENNNIHYNLLVAFEKEMIINQEQTLTKELEVHIGKRILKIPINKLYIKREQKYIFKSQGISKICEDDIYNQVNISRGDIIVNITFN